MDPIERLEAMEAIRTLKARYFRCLDTKDWDGFADVFATDALMDVSGELRDGRTEGEGIVRGNGQITEFVRGAVDDVVTVHHGHTPEIEVTSPTTARAISAMEDKLRWSEGSPIRAMHGHGHYHETYEKLDGSWRIKTLELTRLRLDVEMQD